MKLNDVIYCLAEEGGKPFYIGRSNDWHRRYNEHRRSAVKGHEVKYQHIRKLWAKGSDFEIVVIDHNPGHRYEKYYHYILGCDYELTNQKMGDSKSTEKAAMRSMKKLGREFSNPTEFLTALDIELKEAKARKQAAKTQARIRCETDDTERTLFVGEDPNTKFMSPAMRRIRDKR